MKTLCIFINFHYIRFVAGVGRACLIALLDIRNHNPCSRITTSKYKTLDRVRQNVLEEVQRKWEYRNQSMQDVKQKTLRGLRLESQVRVPSIISNLKVSRRGRHSIRCYASACDSKIWRSYADGVLNITSNDDNDNDRICDNTINDDKNDNSIYSNDNDRHYGDANNNSDKNAVNITESKDTDDDNDKNGDKKKSPRKKSFDGRKISISTYDSTYERQLKSLNSVERTLVSPRTAAASASKARRQSTSSLWPRIRSTTAEVAGFQVAGFQVAGHRRAGSVGSLNLKCHRVVPLSSSYTGKHPTDISDDPVKKFKSFSSHSTVCSKINDGSNANNDENNCKNGRKKSSLKIVVPKNAKSFLTTFSPTSKKPTNANKKDIERKRSKEKNLNMISSEKSFTRERTDDDLNDLIRNSLNISVTSSHAPIHVTCKSQKVVLNTGITGQNLQKICMRTPGEEGEGVLLNEQLLSEKFSCQKSSPSKQSSLSSIRILRKNMVKFSMSKKNKMVMIKDKYVDNNEIVMGVEKTPLQSCLKIESKDSNISEKSNQSPAIYLSSKTYQKFNNITPDKEILIPKIQNNLKSYNRTQISREAMNLNSGSDRSSLKGILAKNHYRNSSSTNENLHDTSAVKNEIRKKRNSVP